MATTYGYDFGTVKTRFDLFDAGLARIEDRLAKLVPAPVRKIPILIGGSGTKRTLPAVARHADIWHTFLTADAFTAASTLVDRLAEKAGRNGRDIERSVTWWGAEAVDAYLHAGATTFITEIHPTPEGGFDFTVLEEMIRWRDQLRR